MENKTFSSIDSLQQAIQAYGYIADRSLITTLFLAFHMHKPVLLEGPPGVGKAQPLWSKIKTPNGWVKMGDVKVNDVVSTPDGKTSKVIGVFPQGKQDVYRITFYDGRTAECSYDHLWLVYSKEWKSKTRVMSLGEIISYQWDRLYIPLIEPANNQAIDLPLDPYILGVLLGNGDFKQGDIRFTSADDEVLSYFSSKLTYGYELKKDECAKYEYHVIMNEEHVGRFPSGKDGTRQDHYVNLIEELGLLKTNLYTRFIPDIYKHSSLQQKLQILRGLMDTDGYITKAGAIQFATSSETLALDVQYLIRSIGGVCKITTKIPKYIDKNEKREENMSYVLHISYQDPKSLINLSRKKDRVSDSYQHTKSELYIKNIEKIAYDDVQCIMIDHPEHLYITDNFVVTHNTEIANVLAKLLGSDDPIRLQCYEGIDDAKALYEWNYKKQLLYIEATKNNHEWREIQDDIYSDQFLSYRPILRAILAETPQVLLIDEIDKSEEDLEALLLEVLSSYQISIPEIGTMHANSKPMVILTSNNQRDLTDATRRRCIYYYIDYPSMERELQIIYARIPDIDKLLATQVVYLVNKLRQEKLKKHPSISETLDWVRALVKLGATSLDATLVQDTINLIIKKQEDMQQAIFAVDSSFKGLPKKPLNVVMPTVTINKPKDEVNLPTPDKWNF